MFEPATIIAAIGAMSALGACGAGAMVRRAHAELVGLAQPPIGQVLDRAFGDVAAEPIPPEMRTLNDRIDAIDKGARND